MSAVDSIISAVRSRGCDARDLRDAAHEAYHALRAGVRPGKWDRTTVRPATEAEVIAWTSTAAYAEGAEMVARVQRENGERRAAQEGAST